MLSPENADGLADYTSKDPDDPDISESDYNRFANLVYEYDSNGRVTKTKERTPTAAGGGPAHGNTPHTTVYDWDVNANPTDLNDWKLHCVVDRNDDSRVIFDINELYNLHSATHKSHTEEYSNPDCLSSGIR